MIIKGKLKSFLEVKKNSKGVFFRDLDKAYVIYHSTSQGSDGRYLSVPEVDVQFFDSIVDIVKYEKIDDRQIYRVLKSGNVLERAKYYEEWFEWIGEPPYEFTKPLDDDIWEFNL